MSPMDPRHTAYSGAKLCVVVKLPLSIDSVVREHDRAQHGTDAHEPLTRIQYLAQRCFRISAIALVGTGDKTSCVSLAIKSYPEPAKDLGLLGASSVLAATARLQGIASGAESDVEILSISSDMLQELLSEMAPCGPLPTLMPSDVLELDIRGPVTGAYALGVMLVSVGENL